MRERKIVIDQAVIGGRSGVSDGFRTSPRCCNVVIRQDMMDYTMQRPTATSQCLGGFVESSSIARSGVPFRAVSLRVLPKAVTHTVTPQV
jgi:hypothetical protein